MADDYDVDVDDMLDMDDGWLYVEDEFNLADELAEGQLANPGYCGTNYEIEWDAYEFDLFMYWDDLQYADDAYWDYGLPGTGGAEGFQKRKRGEVRESVPHKRRKSAGKRVRSLDFNDRDAEPLIFSSREERLQSFFRSAPQLESREKYAFLPDWKQRFAHEDGAVENKQMPAAMRRAAEGQDEDSPPKKPLSGITASMREEEPEDDEEGWEDEDENADDENADNDGELAIDPDMLKTILREKLGAAGLDGMDESAFMLTLQKMMSGEGDDAAGELADALLGKVTSEAGDEAVSGWLSKQGVALENHDEEADVGPNGTTAETLRDSGSSAQQNSHADSAVEIPNLPDMHKTNKIPMHSGSPTESVKKRPAPSGSETSKKQKKVKFDVPLSSPDLAPATNRPEDELSTSNNGTISNQKATESHTAEAKTTDTAAVDREVSADTNGDTKQARKRKATTATPSENKPAAKKSRSRELESLGAPAEPPSPAPPARRTRSRKAQSGD